MTVVTVLGPVSVNADPDVLLMAIPAAAIAAVVPSGLAVHQYVAELVNAGAIADTEQVDGDAEDRAQDPKNDQSDAAARDGEQAAEVPHS